MSLPVGNGQEGRQGTGVIIQAVHLDGAFRLPEPRPGEYRQAQVDGGRIDGVKGIIEPEPVPRGQSLHRPRML